MISSEFRTFMRSHACRWMCQVQPLSTTKVTPRRPVPRACREALQRSRPTSRARAQTVGPWTAAGLRAAGGSVACFA
eukprot:2948786-Pleurochrysis_carterae.AAC.1